MPKPRLPLRDPRTVARDIPGIMDVLFPRLTGGLVGVINKKMFPFEGVTAVPESLVEKSDLQKAMLFELSMVRAESVLSGSVVASWNECLETASTRQRRHYDSNIPQELNGHDIGVADLAAKNLVSMLGTFSLLRPGADLQFSPPVPGLGWIASGNADFALGQTLIEVKNTERNFGSGDLRQVLMYHLLNYAKAIEGNDIVWKEVLLLNPRRNLAVLLSFDYLIKSASFGVGRIELLELLRSIVCQELERR